jgi:ammonia channel protein AmtB
VLAKEETLVHQRTRAVLLAIVLLIGFASPVLAQDGDVALWSGSSLGAMALAWLVPIGLGLVACGAVPPGRVVTVIRVSWLALGVAVIAYWACGYAFQFGGIGFAVDHPDLAALAREWSWAPLDASWGTAWGVIGLSGYLLQGPASTPTALALFLSQLPWITTAVAIPLWSMQGRTKPFALFLSALLSALLYALLGNWIWGGGWLANLGLNLNLGRGFLDLGGASLVHLTGAASALAGMLAFGTRAVAREAVEQLPLPTLEAEEGTAHTARDGETYVPMPLLHLPLFATLGAWLVLIGNMGWLISTPAHVVGDAPSTWAATSVSLVLAVAGGAMTSLVFGWLTTGEGNGLMTARGAVGALIVVSAGISLLPQWAALAAGAAVGLLVPLVQYVVDHVLRLDDPTSAIAMHGIPSLGGLLLLGAWDPGAQLQAQLTGSIAALLVAFVPSWLLFAAVQGLTHGWQEGYALRLPRPRRRADRPRRRAKPRPVGARRRRARTTASPEVQGPLSKGADGTASRRLPSGWIERARPWLRQARAWVTARLAPRPQAPAASDDGEPGPGTSSEETGAPQLESGG